MSLWIKICGNTSLEDALLSANAGANALGFVFAPSPREVNVPDVQAITAKLPESVEKVGVFVGAKLDEIRKIVEACHLTGVQLHGGEGTDLRHELRRWYPALKILCAFHYEEGFSQHAAVLARDTNIDALLLDSKTIAGVGGTGIAYDWKSAAAGLSGDEGIRSRLIIAGGLTPANVSEAIHLLSPCGVDVVSGVESQLGRKDPEKVRAFVANARAAVSARNALL